VQTGDAFGETLHACGAIEVLGLFDTVVQLEKS